MKYTKYYLLTFFTEDGLYAIPSGPDFKDCHLLDQALTQVEYLEKWGPISSINIKGKRHIVLMDPDLIQEAAADTDLIGKPDIDDNVLFKQLQNPRGHCGMSVMSGMQLHFILEYISFELQFEYVF